MGPQTLAQWVLGHERLELADEVVVSALSEVGLDAVLDRGQPELLQATELRSHERLLGEVRKRRPMPQRQAVAQLGRPRACVSSLQQLPPLPHEPLEDVHVDPLRIDPKLVAAWMRDEQRFRFARRRRLGLQQAPQLGDVVANHLLRGLGRLVPPNLLDQPLDCEGAVRIQQEDREQRTLSDSSKLHKTARLADRQGPKDPEGELSVG